MIPVTQNFYNPVSATALIRAAAAAYGDDHAIARWSREHGCGWWESVEDEATDTRAFVAASNEFAVVAFRGTKDLRNWLTNLDARRVRGPEKMTESGVGIEIHEGFCRALKSVWPRLEELLDGLPANNRTIFFTGHSLGGALAMLALAWWERTTNPERPTGWLYTFGQPRVGNAAWARWYDARWRGKSFRVVHAADVVARVPWLLDFYRHAGTEVFFPDPDSNPRFVIDVPWWRKVPSDARAVYHEWKRGQLALLADHHIDSYLRLLDREARGSFHANLVGDAAPFRQVGEATPP